MKRTILLASLFCTLVASVFVGCKKEEDSSSTTSASSTATTATTATTSSTSNTATTSSTATTATTDTTGTTSTTSTTSSTATTATTDTTGTTSTTSSTSTTSTTSTTGSSGSFVFAGKVLPALTGACNVGADDYEVTGTVMNGDTIINVIVSFGSNQPNGGTYKTVYTGSSTIGLDSTECRIEIELFIVSTSTTQNLKAAANQNITLTRSGTDKYKVAFGNTNFAILPSGSSIRVVSATDFGCE